MRPAGQLCLSELPSGRWLVERWDTHEGQPVENHTRTVKPDGRLLIDLPEIVWDTAYRLHRQP